MGANDYKTKLDQILSSKNYQNIVADTVEEFKEFYTFEMQQRLTKAVTQAMQLYEKPGQNMNKIVADQVDALNNRIFQSKINEIKGMMTVCIMETQGFLDKIDLDAAKLKYIQK